MSKVQLYACLGSGNCFKPWLALHQVGRDFELHLVDVLKGEQKAPGYLQMNPLGVVPYLVTPEGVGIGESNAMLWYLCEGTHLMPEDPVKPAEALQWMFFEQSKLEPFISPARFFTTILPGMAVERADDIAGWRDKALSGLARLNDHLGQNRFMLGEGYSVADIAVFGYTHVLAEAGVSMDEVPHVARWIDDVTQTEGFVPLSTLGAEAATKAA